MKNIITFITSNHKLTQRLQGALKGFVVMKAPNWEAFGSIIKKGNAVGAVVVHLTNSNHWIMLELLRTGYPDIPRFAVIAKGAKVSDDADLNDLAAKYGVTAIYREGGEGLKGLATLIQSVANARIDVDSTTNAAYLAMIGSISFELRRLLGEYTETALRTLPQPNIPHDSQRRLESALVSLKAVRITP